MNIKLILKKEDPIIIGLITNLSIIESFNLRYPRLKAMNVKLEKSKIIEAFSNSVIHPAAQKHPFKIIINADNIETVCDNVWLIDTKSPQHIDDYILLEEVEFEAENVNIP